MLLQMALFHSFLWTCNIPLYIYIFGSPGAWCIITVCINGMRMHKKQCSSDSVGVDGRKDSGANIY